VNGEKAIGGALKEKNEAKKEYKNAIAVGRTACLLEREARNGKCPKVGLEKIRG
jgi:hypothetical protein